MPITLWILPHEFVGDGAAMVSSDMRTIPLDDVTAALVARLGTTTPTLTPRAALETLIGFYVETRVEGCLLPDDGDMLLVQWHHATALDEEDVVVDADTVELDFVRQLILEGEDVEPQQLHLRCRFVLKDADGFVADHVWCEIPDDVEALRDTVIEALGELRDEDGVVVLDRAESFTIELEQV